VAAVRAAGRRLQARGGRAPIFGFEAPLVCALAVGVLAWFGMRQAVIVAANDVDSPGHAPAYARAARLFPDLVFAQYLLGERDLAREDFPAAGVHLDRAIALDPSFPASYLPRGRVRIAQGNLQGAAADADRLIALKPEHPAGYALHAWVDALRGDSTALSRDLAAATKPLPPDTQSWDAYFIQCLVLDAAKQTDDAQAACQHSLALNPRHYQSLSELALFAAEKGDDTTAVQYWTRLLAIDDSSARMWSNRGISEQRLGRYADAERDLSHAAAVDPRDAVTLIHLAEVEVYLGQADKAREADDRAVSIDDTYRCNRLFVDRYTDDAQRAVDDVTALLAMPPDRGCQPATKTASAVATVQSYMLSIRGLAYVQLGQADAGFKDLDAAVATAPDFAGAYDRRGFAFYLRHDYARATDDFAQVLSRLSTLGDEPAAEFHLHRAQLLVALGVQDLALAEAKQAQKQAAIPSVRNDAEALAAKLSAQP
jgi:tetratricopeptide (TPR) repeat protein